VKPFYTNKRKELVKIPKVYFYDLGFRNVCFDNFSHERSDIGFMYENFIFSELVKKGFSLKYWRTKSGAEVDFVVGDGGIIPIEVKSSLFEGKLNKSFFSFVEKYKPKKGYIVSLDFEGKKKVNGCEVFFVPFLKFTGLLGGKIKV